MKKVLALCTALALAMPSWRSRRGRPTFPARGRLTRPRAIPAPARAAVAVVAVAVDAAAAAGPSKLVIKQASRRRSPSSGPWPNGAETVVYKLDASESVNKTGHGRDEVQGSWDGTKLVIAGSAVGRRRRPATSTSPPKRSTASKAELWSADAAHDAPRRSDAEAGVRQGVTRLGSPSYQFRGSGSRFQSSNSASIHRKLGAQERRALQQQAENQDLDPEPGNREPGTEEPAEPFT